MGKAHRFISVWVLFRLFLCANWAYASALPQSYTVAVLRVLNKVSARVQVVRVPVNGQVVVGDLRISVLSCTQIDSEEETQTAAYIQVHPYLWLHQNTFEDALSSKKIDLNKPLFSGFIYAQSPSINGMENPTYDIWLEKCQHPGLTYSGQA